MVDSLIKQKLLAAQLNSCLIEYEARKMGLTTHRIDHLLLTCSDENNNQALFRRAAGPGVTYSADTICMNKDLLKRLWFHHSLPVNPWLAVNGDEIDKAVNFCEKSSWNVVVKPTSCAAGKNVFTDIRNINQLKNACEQIRNCKIISTRYNSPNKILLERKHPGKDYRFWVVNHTMVAVLERARPAIVGDGTSSVAELIDCKKLMRATNPHLLSKPIFIDNIVQERLKTDNVSMDYVLEKDRRIILRGNANMSTGGESIDVTDIVSHRIKCLVESSVKAVPGLSSCAVDVLCVDISNENALDSSNIVLNEIETDAGICGHHFPLFGKPRNVAKHILLGTFPHKAKKNPLEADYIHDFDDNVDIIDEIAYSIKNKYYAFFEENETF